MTITGRVTDQQSGQPVEGATVALKSGNVTLSAVAANDNGLFSVNTNQSADAVEITSVGFAPQIWPLPENINRSSFTLQEQSGILDDVVITATKKKSWVWLIATGFAILVATNNRKKKK